MTHVAKVPLVAVLAALSLSNAVFGGDQVGFEPGAGIYLENGTPEAGRFDIQRAGDNLAAIWFTFRADGSSVWYVAADRLVGVTWSAELFEYSGDRYFATPFLVGELVIDWHDATHASVSFTLDEPGIVGSREIHLADFGEGAAVINLSGHYVPLGDHFRPDSGTGFTLFTDGPANLVNFYFFQDLRAVWAQGLAGDGRFDPKFDVYLFVGAGLCPGCSVSTKSAPSGQWLASVQLKWATYNHPILGWYRVRATLRTDVIPSPLLLGPFQAFQGLFTAASAGLAAGRDELLALTDSKDCFEFSYDVGLFIIPPVITGSRKLAYLRAKPADPPGFYVYEDPACVERFPFPNVPEYLRDSARPTELNISNTGGNIIYVFLGASVNKVLTGVQYGIMLAGYRYPEPGFGADRRYSVFAPVSSEFEIWSDIALLEEFVREPGQADIPMRDMMIAPREHAFLEIDMRH